MTNLSKEAQIQKLKEQNISTLLTVSGIQILGGIGSVIYAHSRGCKTWCKVGYFFGGVIVTGIVAMAVARPIIIKRNAKITDLKSS